jgi:hypothetical protein
MFRLIRSVSLGPKFRRPFSMLIPNVKPPQIMSHKFAGPGKLIAITSHKGHYQVESRTVSDGQYNFPKEAVKTFYIDKLIPEVKQLDPLYLQMDKFFQAVCNGVPKTTTTHIKPQIHSDKVKFLEDGLLNSKLEAQTIIQNIRNFLDLMTKDELQIQKIHQMMEKGMNPSDIKKSLALLQKFVVRVYSNLNFYEMAQQNWLVVFQQIIKSHTHFIPQGDYFNTYMSIYTIAQTHIPRVNEKIEADLNAISVLLKKHTYSEIDTWVITEIFGEWAEYIKVLKSPKN